MREKVKQLLQLIRSDGMTYQQRMLRLRLWSSIWRGLGAIFVGILILALVFAIITFVNEGGSFVSLLFKNNGDLIEPLFNIKDLLIGVSGLIAIFATAWRYKLHEVENLLKTKDAEIKERDSNINDSKRLDDQFAKAVELLKEDNDITVRRGGVYILKNLALKSSDHLQPCIDLLCSLNNWMSSILQNDPQFFSLFDENNKRWNVRYLEEQPWSTKLSNPSTDEEKEVRIDEKKFRNKQLLSRDVLKIVAEILAWYSLEKNNKLQINIKLYQYNLCGIDLRNIVNTAFVDWSYANMQTAILHNVNLDKANMYGVDLSYSLISGCSGKEAVMGQVNFTGASIHNTDFRCATLTSIKAIGVHLLNCKFQGADLNNGIFFSSLFDNVQMQGLLLEPLDISEFHRINDETNFDDSIFYYSCLTGAEIGDLEPQSIVYENIRDEWSNISVDDLMNEYEWSDESKEKLLNAFSRYKKGISQEPILEGGKFFVFQTFKVTSNYVQVGRNWANIVNKIPALKRHIEFRFETLDDDLLDVLHEVQKGYYAEARVLNKIEE